MKFEAGSQMSVYDPLYQHVGTEINEEDISQSKISSRLSLTTREFVIDETDLGDQKHSDALHSLSHSEPSIYKDYTNSVETHNVNQLSNDKELNKHYVYSNFRKADIANIESAKSDANLDMYQKPADRSYPEAHSRTDYLGYSSNKENVDSITNGKEISIDKLKTGFSESVEYRLSAEFDQSSADGVVFEFGDGSDSSFKEPSFEIDPNCLTLPSSDDFTDYLLSNEYRRFGDRATNTYDYVPSVASITDIHIDRDESEDTLFDEHRTTNSFFPYIHYDNHIRADTMTGFIAASLSSYDSSGISSSGYISSDTSEFNFGKTDFMPSTPFEVNFSFLEEVPIYNISH